MKVVDKKLFDYTYLEDGKIVKIAQKFDNVIKKKPWIDTLAAGILFANTVAGWILLIFILDALTPNASPAIMFTIPIASIFLNFLLFMNYIDLGDGKGSGWQKVVKTFGKLFVKLRRRKLRKKLNQEKIVLGAVTSRNQMYGFKVRHQIVSDSNQQTLVHLTTDVFCHSPEKGWEKDMMYSLVNQGITIDKNNPNWRDQFVEKKEQFVEKAQKEIDALNDQFKPKQINTTEQDEKQLTKLFEEEIQHLVEA